MGRSRSCSHADECDPSNGTESSGRGVLAMPNPKRVNSARLALLAGAVFLALGLLTSFQVRGNAGPSVALAQAPGSNGNGPGNGNSNGNGLATAPGQNGGGNGL